MTTVAEPSLQRVFGAKIWYFLKERGQPPDIRIVVNTVSGQLRMSDKE